MIKILKYIVMYFKRVCSWVNIFANNTSDTGLISKTYKELLQINCKRQTAQLKMGKELE